MTGLSSLFTQGAKTIVDNTAQLVQLSNFAEQTKRQQAELSRQEREEGKLFDIRTRVRAAELRSVQGQTAAIATSGGVTGKSLSLIKQEAAIRTAITQASDEEARAAERLSNIEARRQLEENLRTARIQTGLNITANFIELAGAGQPLAGSGG